MFRFGVEGIRNKIIIKKKNIKNSVLDYIIVVELVWSHAKNEWMKYYPEKL